jgi:2-furoate---CoA ligase
MLDLGTSFLASVARDPNALAIADGGVRFSYAEWYRRISALVVGFDALKLKPGDRLVTLLQNNWQAATIHWACQFAGIVVTPLNWRCTADELDYCLENAEARALVYEAVSAEAVNASKTARTIPRIAVGLATDTTFETLAAAGINIEMISTSAIRISCIVREEQVEEAVQALHAAFEL